MRTDSVDLRRKIVDAVRRGLTKTEVSRTFNVSRFSVKRYVKMDEEFGALAPSKPPGSTPKVNGAPSDCWNWISKNVPQLPWHRGASTC